MLSPDPISFQLLNIFPAVFLTSPRGAYIRNNFATTDSQLHIYLPPGLLSRSLAKFNSLTEVYSIYKQHGNSLQPHNPTQ